MNARDLRTEIHDLQSRLQNFEQSELLQYPSYLSVVAPEPQCTESNGEHSGIQNPEGWQLPTLTSFNNPSGWRLPPISLYLHRIPDLPRVEPNEISESPREEQSVWNICEEITCKKNWYSKVFDDDIVSKWRQEISVQSGHTFDFALKLLRSTAQGVNHRENCNWEALCMCNDCKDQLKRDILANPEDFGLSVEDIEDDGTQMFHDDRFPSEFPDAWERCPHAHCKCTAPYSTLEDYVDYFPRDLIDSDLHIECKSIIAEMAAQEEIDWHPGSQEQVRDIIHPSMNCYVTGVSVHGNGFVAPNCEENVRYQWLPSEFMIDLDGQVHLTSYINNLKADKYPRFIPMVEQVFQRCIPSLEHILHKQLRGRPLQVIVKVGSINLDPSKSHYPGGSWHIEGMPQEHIAATAIHYVDVDNITDSFLEFRKPVILNEYALDYPQSDHKYTTHHYGLEPQSHFDGQMNRYLGLIRCHEGASVVFPNDIQHRVKDFSLVDGATSSLRTILAFFIIDPDHRIISTEDVPPQQGLFTVSFNRFIHSEKEEPR